jgi:hypothetical protein
VRKLVALLISVVVCLAYASTTTANAPVFAYDVPTISRVEVREFDDASASPARLIDGREESAWPPAEPSGASTTPPLDVLPQTRQMTSPQRSVDQPG